MRSVGPKTAGSRRSTTRLGVNVDHVATIRQARLGATPDPGEAALACEAAGADSIVCHLREDRRHIQDHDLSRLLTALTIPLNLEMSIAPEIVDIALRLKPRQVTLVPERRRELTTEGGLDVVRLGPRLRQLVRRFDEQGIVVSLFIDPNPSQVAASRDAGATTVELHTGEYASAKTAIDHARRLRALAVATEQARAAGLRVAAGHGLDYDNVRGVTTIRGIEEVNIGFSIIARSVFVGIGEAVRSMKALLR